MFRKISTCLVIALVAVICISDDAYNLLTYLVGPGALLGMAFTRTALDGYIKRTYDPKFIDNSISEMSDQMLSTITKKTDGEGGEDFTWMADVDDVDGGSPDFPTAQTAASANASTAGSKFRSDWFPYSDVAQLTSDIIGRTRNKDGAWQEATDTAMRKKMRAIAHNNGVVLQGYGWGEISTIASVSGSTFVPGIRSDITKYIKGMPLHFSQSLHGHVLRSTTVLYVTKVSYTPGNELVTLSGTLASVSAVNGDTAFRAGARENSATPARLVPVGFGGFVPNQTSGGTDMTDATVTTMLGVDRTSNSRLYGTWIDATGGGSAISALIDGCQEALTVGNAKTLRCFASKGVYAQIAKDLNNGVVYNDNPQNKTVGTRRLTIYSSDKQEATLEVSRLTNDNQIWGFAPPTVILKSIGGAPHLDSEDGLTMARQSSAAGYEIRWFQQYLYQFADPASTLRVQLV